jgi:hypothetical protein
MVTEDQFLAAAASARRVLGPERTRLVEAAQSLEEASELIRRRAAEPDPGSAGFNPFGSITEGARVPDLSTMKRTP